MSEVGSAFWQGVDDFMVTTVSDNPTIWASFKISLPFNP